MLNSALNAVYQTFYLFLFNVIFLQTVLSNQNSVCISNEAEKYILDELRSDLILNMSPSGISYLMVTNHLLVRGEYKRFVEMKNEPDSKLNEFLLGCLVRRQPGFLTIFQKLLLGTTVKHVAKEMELMMAGKYRVAV